MDKRDGKNGLEVPLALNGPPVGDLGHLPHPKLIHYGKLPTSAGLSWTQHGMKRQQKQSINCAASFWIQLSIGIPI